MGIYDRDYYRREGPSFLDSFQLRGRVCKWLIILNIAVFAIQLLTRREIQAGWHLDIQPGAFTDALILDVQAVLHGQIWRLLTYAFLHDPSGIWHILFNMWFLWMFGSELEDLYGSKEFLSIYLLSAILGGAAFCALGAITQHQYCLGASGAVTCVMVLFALHYPNRTILLFFVLPIPVWILVLFQVAQDTFIFLGSVGNQLKSRTAVSVHLAGAAFAFLYYKNQWRLMTLWPRLGGMRLSRKRPKLRVYRGEDEAAAPDAVAVAASPAGDIDEQLEAKLDAVLEKVARSGQESLNESERQILLRASEIYRKRRS